jgi:thiamine-phosphate diphosphorylase
MMSPRPLICLVTDRRRLAERLGLDPEGTPIAECLADLVARAAEAGIDLVQVRENDLPAAAMADWVRRLLETVRGTRTRIVVNDRLDVALATSAHGMHLKDGAVALEPVRAAAPAGFLIGQSIHSPERAADASADYLVFGTVFPTRSKLEAHDLAGLAGLRAAVRQARVPVLAIGGVKLTHLAGVAATGAAGIAAVDLFLPDGPDMVVPLQRISEQVRQTFDSVGPAP